MVRLSVCVVRTPSGFRSAVCASMSFVIQSLLSIVGAKKEISRNQETSFCYDGYLIDYAVALATVPVLITN